MEKIKIELPDYKGYKNFIYKISYSPFMNQEWYCGYAVLPDSHILYNAESEFDRRIIDIDVHGGVTYMKNHIIGFDCNHYEDDIETCNKEFVISEIHKMIDHLIEM